MEQINVGIEGERIAANHIQSKGYIIQERNYSWGKGEIDIIAKKDNTLIICEVKTRQSNYFGSPCSAVTRAKQRQIIKITNKYLSEKNLDLEIRFDIIGIVMNQHETQIEHIENAFVPYGT